ncbi:DUF1636 domain-containing protein [Pyxidicoccus fallax]|uniref:DUF1636 domain-containing protein n=1 Tax=Pyxidicoccus fallax TaxID=394095 RepID=UPI001FEACEFF|nr:DUF1636 domain-containing protein [Pyxidicoccus fallax]
MRDERGGGPAEEVEVLVCRKCLMRGGARAGGMDLPRWLQGAFAERGLSEQVRVLPTGCMNQCPRGRVTVLVTSGDGRGGAMMLVDPRLQREQLVQAVERRARGPIASEPPAPIGDERGTVESERGGVLQRPAPAEGTVPVEDGRGDLT